MFEPILACIRQRFPGQASIPLHAPVFCGNERQYVLDAIDSTFVSSVGVYVDRFERMMEDITGAKKAVAIVNGTCALHLALYTAGVTHGDLVITQPLSFVATANAIAHCGAEPVFVDVDKDTLGMSPDALEHYLRTQALLKDGYAYDRSSGRRLAACVPMHTFGFPCRIDSIAEVCQEFNIPLIEDAAESLGSFFKNIHTGRFGAMGIFSFNGNKTVTSGAGGAIITNNEALGLRLKHLSTTAKQPHPYYYKHDQVGFNYRMPNLVAALACAQLEQLPAILRDKRQLAQEYAKAFADMGLTFITEPPQTRANYWLNCILLDSSGQRDQFLQKSNQAGVQTRPIWNLLNTLPMYAHCAHGPLDNSIYLTERLVNIPSSPRLGA